MAKEVATKGKNELTTEQDNSVFENTPTGLENVGAQDLMIPRLAILQGLSPQVTRGKPEFIEGAQAGDFCDTGTGAVFKGELEVLPCFYARIFLEWAPRDSNKGLIHNYGTDGSILAKCKQDDKRRYFTPEGNLIQETGTFYTLNLSAGGQRSFIPLASTQLKAARRWNTLITAERIKRPDGSEFQPPIFYRSWKATSVLTQNASGSWYMWKFEPGRPILEIDPSKSLLNEAKEFLTQARDGLVQGDVAGLAEDNATEEAM